MRSDIYLPIASIFAAILVVALLAYGNAKGPMLTAFFPSGTEDPFSLASQHPTRIVESSKNSVTLYAPTEHVQKSLLNAGAILIDTQGASTCLTP